MFPLVKTPAFFAVGQMQPSASLHVAPAQGTGGAKLKPEVKLPRRHGLFSSVALGFTTVGLSQLLGVQSGLPMLLVAAESLSNVTSPSPVCIQTAAELNSEVNFKEGPTPESEFPQQTNLIISLGATGAGKSGVTNLIISLGATGAGKSGVIPAHSNHNAVLIDDLVQEHPLYQRGVLGLLEVAGRVSLLGEGVTLTEGDSVYSDTTHAKIIIDSSTISTVTVTTLNLKSKLLKQIVAALTCNNDKPASAFPGGLTEVSQILEEINSEKKYYLQSILTSKKNPECHDLAKPKEEDNAEDDPVLSCAQKVEVQFLRETNAKGKMGLVGREFLEPLEASRQKVDAELRQISAEDLALAMVNGNSDEEVSQTLIIVGWQKLSNSNLLNQVTSSNIRPELSDTKKINPVLFPILAPILEGLYVIARKNKDLSVSPVLEDIWLPGLLKQQSNMGVKTVKSGEFQSERDSDSEERREVFFENTGEGIALSADQKRPVDSLESLKELEGAICNSTKENLQAHIKNFTRHLPPTNPFLDWLGNDKHSLLYHTIQQHVSPKGVIVKAVLVPSNVLKTRNLLRAERSVENFLGEVEGLREVEVLRLRRRERGDQSQTGFWKPTAENMRGLSAPRLPNVFSGAESLKDDEVDVLRKKSLGVWNGVLAIFPSSLSLSSTSATDGSKDDSNLVLNGDSPVSTSTCIAGLLSNKHINTLEIYSNDKKLQLEAKFDLDQIREGLTSLRLRLRRGAFNNDNSQSGAGNAVMGTRFRSSEIHTVHTPEEAFLMLLKLGAEILEGDTV